MRRIGLVLTSVLATLFFFSTSSHAQWAATYWGSNLYTIHKTSDNGFIASVSEAGGIRIKKFSQTGVPQWSKSYYDRDGGMLYYSSYYTNILNRSPLQPTSDGGYALATLIYQQPNGTYGVGRHDIWFLKLDEEGEIEWQRTYGGADYDAPSDLKQTNDGGYILAGRTKSFGQQGVWVVKLDASGNVEWEKVYGGYVAMSIQQTSDNGYILTGYTSSTGAGGNDIWVVKLDANGDIQTGLQKTYGGAQDDTGHVIIQTDDGGYLIGGETRSFNIQPGTYACMWILKLDASLNITWQKTYGGSSLLPDSWGVDKEVPYDIIETIDGNYIVAGSTNHFGHGAQEAWILKLDASNQGAIIWEKTYGGYELHGSPSTRTERFLSVLETADGSVTAAGSTQMDYGELGFIVTMNADGQVPGCSIMGDSTAIVTDTAVSGQTTQAIPQNTSLATTLPPGTVRLQTNRLKEFICPDGYDLSINIEDKPDPIRPNHYVAYVLRAENLGTGDNTNVSVDAVLPAELAYFSSTSTQGTTSETGGTVTFDIGSLAAGESTTLSIIARAASVGTHTVTAEITSDEIAFDQVAENNTASEATRVSNLLNVTVDNMDWEKFDMVVDSRGYAHMAYTEDYELRYATNASGEWLHWILVDGDDVKNPAIALDSTDRVHIIFAQGPEIETNALKYIQNVNGSWSAPESIVAAAGTAWSTDLALDSDDSLHLCYIEAGPASQASLIYMTTRGQDPGEWSGTGLHAAAYDAAALALDSNSYAHVIFYSPQVIYGNFATGGVGYVTNAPSGVWQTIEEVDTDWAGCQLEGMTLDIVIDSSDDPHIVFNGDADGEFNEDTRYAVRTGGVWVLDEVEDGDCYGAGKSIAMDLDGNVHVSYYRTQNNDLRVADNISGPWNRTTVSSDGWFNRIAVDRWGQAHVGYYDGGDLKYAVVLSLPDSDGDGVGDAEEAEAPNSGDGNNDGTQDSEQSHVVSLETVGDAHMVTLVAPTTTALTRVRSSFNPSPDNMPDNADFPFGFFEFTLLGADIGISTSVDLLLPNGTANSYFKYGPTPLLPADHWHLFDWDDETGAQASGSTITLNLLDGQRGDNDLTANGIIRDPGGPAVGPAGLQHIRLSPPILEFGELMVGESTQLDLTVMNVGESNLSIDSITPPDAPFSIPVENCSGEVLVADGSCLVSVSFDPALLGDAREILLVLSDDPSFPSLGVTLLGIGMPVPEPEIQVMPASLAFGDVDTGSSSDLSISVPTSGSGSLIRIMKHILRHSEPIFPIISQPTR